jgi:homopolymeric O-antigen transport system ATP-binding protein
MAGDVAIRAEGLGKKYIIGHEIERERYTALRDVAARTARNVWKRGVDAARGHSIVRGETTEEFWALRNVSFEVMWGEVLGIIGRNGAGKSTLLKILSRITEPSEGLVTITGRVASLLEVGTGFHPELTGRENIYLNGAILGMSRAEIRRKFDQIVDFSGVEKFIDTPVKRYSSGMQVRLAFSVAAHLEPEILIIDEVLAVGDAEFQKKCLGRMDYVSRHEGRVVLFVSHNIEAVLRLCNRTILLDHGQVLMDGDVQKVSSAYLVAHATPKITDLRSKSRPEWKGNFLGNARLTEVAAITDQESWSLPFGEQLLFDVSVQAQSAIDNIELGIALSARGFEVATWTNACSRTRLSLRSGTNIFRIRYEGIVLLPKQYSIGIWVNSPKGIEDHIVEAADFEVTPNVKAAEINAQKFRGALVPTVEITKLETAIAAQTLIEKIKV